MCFFIFLFLFLSYFPPRSPPLQAASPHITPVCALSEALSFIIPNLRDCPEAYLSSFLSRRKDKSIHGGEFPLVGMMGSLSVPPSPSLRFRKKSSPKILMLQTGETLHIFQGLP